MAESLWRSDLSAKFILQEAKEKEVEVKPKHERGVGEWKDEKRRRERYNKNNNNNNEQYLGMFGAWLPEAGRLVCVNRTVHSCSQSYSMCGNVGVDSSSSHYSDLMSLVWAVFTAVQIAHKSCREQAATSQTQQT
jgi:hypothetical protein